YFLLSFILVFTKIVNSARPAPWFARCTDIPPMQNQPVMGVQQKLFRYQLQQLFFYFQNVFSRCNSGAIGYTENMCVHSYRRLSESGIQYNVSGFAANSRQGFKFLPG